MAAVDSGLVGPVHSVTWTRGHEEVPNPQARLLPDFLTTAPRTVVQVAPPPHLVESTGYFMSAKDELASARSAREHRPSGG